MSNRVKPKGPKGRTMRVGAGSFVPRWPAKSTKDRTLVGKARIKARKAAQRAERAAAE